LEGHGSRFAFGFPPRALAYLRGERDVLAFAGEFMRPIRPRLARFFDYNMLV